MANPPSIKDIKKRFKSYTTHYSQLHQQQKDIDKYYELTFDADVPKRYPTRMPPTARDWVDVGVRHFTLDNPKSRVYPRKDNDTARQEAAMLETLYNFWMKIYIAQIKNAAKKVLIRGEAFFKIGMDDTYFGAYNGKPLSELSEGEMEEYKEKRLFHFPLILTTPDPINVYPSPAHNGLVPVDTIESFNITVAEAEAMCARNGWEWKTNKAPDKTVAWFSFYNADWRYFELDNVSVLPGVIQPNILGFTPYVHFGAGFGQTNYEGKPEYEYRPLLYSKQDMCKMEARMLSQIDAINARYAWLRHILSGTNPELVKKWYPRGIPTDPDELLVEIPGEMEIKLLEVGQIPPGLFQEYSLLQAQASAPAVLSGVKLPGVYSGQHQEDLMSTAKPIYKDPFKNIEDALAVSMGMGARIIEKVYNSPVQVKNFASENKAYMQLNPSDIKGHYDCEVSLLAEPPEATDIRKALGKTLRQGGSISHMTELRQYHDMSEKEAEDEIAQQAAEAAMQEPALREAVVKDAMERLGMHKELEAIQEAEEEAKRLVKSKPPVPQGEGMTTGEVKRRGRTTTGLEPLTTPHEHEVGGRD